VYYRDVIGNISTSHVRTERDGSVTMEVRCRERGGEDSWRARSRADAGERGDCTGHESCCVGLRVALAVTSAAVTPLPFYLFSA